MDRYCHYCEAKLIVWIEKEFDRRTNRHYSYEVSECPECGEQNYELVNTWTEDSAPPHLNNP